MDQYLSASELSAKFPGWSVPADFRAVYQPYGGIIQPEKMTIAHSRLAKVYGAHILENKTVVDIIPLENINNYQEEVKCIQQKIKSKASKPSPSHTNAATRGVYILCSDGSSYLARKVVLSNGPWLSSFLSSSSQTTLGQLSPRLNDISSLLTPERQVVSWFNISEEAKKNKVFEKEKFPVWVCTYQSKLYYGFPLFGSTPGIKIGLYHHLDEKLSIHDLNDHEKRVKRLAPIDGQVTGEFVKALFPQALSQEVVKMSTCIFTNTPDEHFIIDDQPDVNYPQIALISACSGHGYKFTNVLGEVMAQLALQGKTTHSVEWLKANRFFEKKQTNSMINPHHLLKQ